MDGTTLVYLFAGTFVALMGYTVTRGVLRYRGIEQAASRLGLVFVGTDERLEKRLLGKLPIFDHEAIALSEILSGRRDGAPYYVFDLAYYHRNNLRGRRDRERVGTVTCFELPGANLSPLRLWPRGKRCGARGNVDFERCPALGEHYEAEARSAEPFTRELGEYLLRAKEQNWGIEASGDWVAFSRYFSRDEQRSMEPARLAEYLEQVVSLKNLVVEG